MTQLAIVRERLKRYRIRDAADYAEVLVAEALNGERKSSGVNRGFDVTAPRFGRIEVKCRQLPSDGRKEERVTVGGTKEHGFDYLAIVVFFPDFHVKGAVLVPYHEVWNVVATHEYSRISYAQACELAGAIDLTGKVSRAAEL